MIENDKHEKAGIYCPHCLLELLRVKKTGVTFCPDSCGCDYIYKPNDKRCKIPLARGQSLMRRERILIDKIKQRLDEIDKYRAEIADIEREVLKFAKH